MSIQIKYVNIPKIICETKFIGKLKSRALKYFSSSNCETPTSFEEESTMPIIHLIEIGNQKGSTNNTFTKLCTKMFESSLKMAIYHGKPSNTLKVVTSQDLWILTCVC